MRARSLLNFNPSNFLSILVKKIVSFLELDDALVSNDIQSYLATQEDEKKLKKLIEKIDSHEKSPSEPNSESFSNGKTLYIN